LDLRNNEIDAVGGRALANALKQNHTLQYLSLDGNVGVPQLILEEIEAAININSHPITYEPDPQLMITMSTPMKVGVPISANRPRPGDDVDDSQFKTHEYYAQIESSIQDEALKDNVLLLH
jgi:hypothetical protein